MYDVATTIALWIWLFIAVRVCYDLYTYTNRQAKWELTHPGKTYIRGYKRKALADRIDKAL